MFFKRNNLNRKTTKRPRLYRMRRAVLDWFLFVGNLVLIVGALTSGYYFLVSSNIFKLKEVELSGSFRHTTREGVSKLAEVPFGKNLFTINLNRLEKNIRRHPWIRRVEVRRQLPGKLEIHVEEYEPIALVRVRQPALPVWQPVLPVGDDYLMSREGKIFKKLRSDEVGAIHPPSPSGLRRTGELPLPVISGFDPVRLKKFPSYYGAHVREAFLFLNRLLVSPAGEAFGVKEVHYSVTEGITVTTAKNGAEIYFGRGDYEQKLARWQEFAVAKEGENSLYRRIDLHVGGKIFARR